MSSLPFYSSAHGREWLSRIHPLQTLPCRIKDGTGKIAVQRDGKGSSVSSISSRNYHAKD
jgi:hypothetical protein